MKYTSIIFDWDGTIGMTLHLWLAGYRVALQNQSHTFPDAVIAREFFYQHDKAALKYPQIDFEQLIDETRPHVFAHLSDLVLYPYAQETLQRLTDNGIKLALVSSSSRHLLKEGLAKHNLGGYFQSIIGGDDVERHKPHPDAFLQTFENIGAIPTETLIIGDAATDVQAGKNVGTATCLFMPPENAMFYDNETLIKSGQDFTISSLAELPPLCK